MPECGCVAGPDEKVTSKNATSNEKASDNRGEGARAIAI